MVVSPWIPADLCHLENVGNGRPVALDGRRPTPGVKQKPEVTCHIFGLTKKRIQAMVVTPFYEQAPLGVVDVPSGGPLC